MFIRFQNNIYNLNSYSSIVKGVVAPFSNKKSFIQLIRNDNNFISLAFENAEIRNYILMKIWDEIKKHTECFDIDEELKIYLETNKYNI